MVEGARKLSNHSWYFDLKLIAEYLTLSHRYHHTASATMFYALHEGLTLIEEEGLQNRWERHHQAHLEFVKTMEGMGLEMLVAPEHRIWNLNTPKVPQGVDEAKVRTTLLKEHGIEIAGGFWPACRKDLPHRPDGAAGDEQHVHDFADSFAAALRGAGYKY